MTNKEMEGAIADALGLSPEQRELKAAKSGSGVRTKLDYKLAWSRTFLRGLGTIENVEPSTWVVTATGKEATEDDIDAAKQQMIDKLQEGNRVRAEERAARRRRMANHREPQ
jgi:restriction system protein